MKIFESLTDAIKHAAKKYTEENANKIIVKAPKKLNVWRHLEGNGSSKFSKYWWADFSECKEKWSNLQNFISESEVSEIFNDAINDVLAEDDVVHISKRWQSDLWENDYFITEINKKKFEIIKS